MTDFRAARINMVDCQIHTAAVSREAILEAFRTVPRETFLPENMRGIACADESLPLGSGRFLPEPAVHAKMLQAADPRAEDNVLDIGGATGYPAAILSSMAGSVTALEEDQEFLDRASGLWRDLSIGNITGVKGRLPEGYPARGPYKLIFINGAVSEIPAGLAAQLAPGGRMLAILKKPGARIGQAVLIQGGAGAGVSFRSLFEAAGHYLPGFTPAPAFSF